MVDFKVTVLGNGSAVPTRWHNPASQVVFYGKNKFLVDCAEGTQMQLIKYKISLPTINHIFISHLHGDHFFGLIGIISSNHLAGRQKTLTVYSPKGLEALIHHHFKLTDTTLKFPLQFISHEDANDDFIYEDKQLTVRLIPLKHSIPSWGFLFKENERPLRIDKSFVEQHEISIEDIQKIKKGLDFKTSDGQFFENSQITMPPFPPKSYAYCSDTAYDESIVGYIKNVNLLYHESTFDNSMRDLASTVLHSTAEQAATIAKKAGVGKLLLGHYSGRFKDLSSLENEARKVFPNSVLSREGLTYFIE